MEDNIKFYKQRFDITLEPIKAMLINLHESLSHEDWVKFVDRTRASVIAQPDQYLGHDLPDRATLGIIVTMIFEEFLAEEVTLS